jgi:hypothetical protein
MAFTPISRSEINKIPYDLRHESEQADFLWGNRDGKINREDIEAYIIVGGAEPELLDVFDSAIVYFRADRNALTPGQMYGYGKVVQAEIRDGMNYVRGKDNILDAEEKAKLSAGAQAAADWMSALYLDF